MSARINPILAWRESAASKPKAERAVLVWCANATPAIAQFDTEESCWNSSVNGEVLPNELITHWCYVPAPAARTKVAA